jgi:hypothetical protein
VIREFLRPIHRKPDLPGAEIVSQLAVPSATPMALLLLLGNTSSESKIIRSNGLLFPSQLREKIDLYLSQYAYPK